MDATTLASLLRPACPRRRTATLEGAARALLARWSARAPVDALQRAVAPLGLDVTVHPQQDPRIVTIWRDRTPVAHVGRSGGLW